MKGIRKSLLSIIIALAMVITSAAFPEMNLLHDETVQVRAAEADYGIVWLDDESVDPRRGTYVDENGVTQTISFTKWTDTLAESQNGPGKTASNSLPGAEGNYYLNGDVTITAGYDSNNHLVIPGWTTPNGTTKLCLNGKTVFVDYSGDQSRSSYGIRVENNSTLDLYDTHNGGGSITCIDSNISIIIDDILRSSFNMYGGILTGMNYSGNYTSAPIFVDSGATAVMYGGSITGNTSSDVSAVQIYTSSSRFVLSGGTITNNSTTSYVSSAVHPNNSSGVFEMSGGSITNNTGGRGGVNASFGTFTMTGGEISGNQNRNGDVANVYTDSARGGTVTMTGGKIDGGFIDENNDYATVTFNKNDGTNTTTTQYIKKGTATALNKNAFTRIGYTLTRWCTSTNDGDLYDPDQSVTLQDNLQLYAEWRLILPIRPTIDTQPEDIILTEGYSSGNTLSVNATAATDTTYILSYQWYSCDNYSKTNSQAVAGATAADYTLPTGKTAGTEYYYCNVTATRTDNNLTETVSSYVARVMVTYDGNPYAPLIPTDSDTAQQVADKKVTFNSRQWYIIDDNSSSVMAGSLTLFAVNSFINMAFDDDNNDGDGYSNDYSASTVKTYLDNVTSPNGAFANVADAINEINLTDVNVTGAKLYLLSLEEIYILPVEVKKSIDYEWWLRSSTIPTCYAIAVGMYGDTALVYNVEYPFGVRPALQLDLSKVIFSSDTKTFSLKRGITLSGGANTTVSGATTQDVADGSSISAVTYTANTGYHFEDFADITDNGITVTKTSDTVVTVSGIPTGDVSITVPDAVANPSNNQYVPSTPDPEPAPVSNTDIKTYKNEDGSVTTKTTARHDDGSVTSEEKTEYEDGSYTLVSETKDGKLLTKTEETKTISKKGTATVTTNTVNADGSTLEKTVKTTKKGYVETSTIASEVTKKGNILVAVTMTNSDGYGLSMGFTVKKGKVTLTSFEATEGIITIPNEITVNGETIPVAAILKVAFKNNTDITNVSIGKNVTVIGTKAFYGAKNLNKIFIYGNLEKVAKGAFKKIAEDAVIKIKADKENYKRIVELIKASGVGKGVKFKRIK